MRLRFGRLVFNCWRDPKAAGPRYARVLELSRDDVDLVEDAEQIKDVFEVFDVLKKSVEEWPPGGTREEPQVRWHPRIAVAGSAALLGVEAIMKNKEGAMGRWVKGGGLWKANDVDVWVCGRAGARKASFRSTVSRIMKKMEKVLKVSGKSLVVHEEYAHSYTREKEPFLIQDVSILGNSMKVSFIQAGGYDDVWEVVKDFDLDIVQAMMNFHCGSFFIPEPNFMKIHFGAAFAFDMLLGGSVPTKKEMESVLSTLKRMKKYSDRGYHFARYFRMWTLKERRGTARWFQNSSRGSPYEGVRHASHRVSASSSESSSSEGED